MRQRRVITLVSMEELEADIALHCIAVSSRWIYFEPPRIIFEPCQPAPFLPSDSNKRESIPKD